MKRIFDLLVIFLIAPLVILICAVVAILYYLIERENPFFSQTRLGVNEYEFTILKLRTMRTSALDMATHEVDKELVTRFGKMLRATKIDELPQLWNVFVGDMSLVGPRPGLVSQLELREERRARKVFSVRPGVTGISQIRGIDMSDPIRLAESDEQYLRDVGLLYDLRIIIATAFGAGSGDKVL